MSTARSTNFEFADLSCFTEFTG